MNRPFKFTCSSTATAVCLAAPLWLGAALSPAFAKGKPAPAAPAPAQAPAAKAEPAPAAAAPGPVQGVENCAPMSKTLERALKLYDAEDHYMSTIELDKVIDKKTGDDECRIQQAEFFMGKALFNLRFYSASLGYFNRVVEKGKGHRYYEKTLQWLASLSKFLPESAGVLEKIGKYQRADLENPALEPVRHELYYLLGRYYYTKGQFKEALELFGLVPLDSQYFARTKFLEGITHVREYRGQAAAESFRAILRKHKEKPDKETREFEELANLSLARVFYSTKQYPLSIKYYEKIGEDSPDWLASLFEQSWALFQIDGYSKALGNIHTLNAPFFENEFYPESMILKAVIYFQTCNYDRSLETIVEFNQTYPKLLEEIRAVLAKTSDPTEFYEYVLKIRRGEAGLSDRVQRAVEGSLQDRTLTKTLEYVAELDRELRQVDKADPNWKSTQIATNVLQDLTLQKSIASNEAGQLARKRLERLGNEITELIKQAIKVEFETLNGTKGQLEASIRGEQGQSLNVKVKRYAGPPTGDDEHLRWDFNGEYWKDELGYYWFNVRNRCDQAKGALPKP